MSDPRSLLERESRRFTQTDGAFERLQRRRDRKHRNQRIEAGVLGLVIAIGSQYAPGRPVLASGAASLDRTKECQLGGRGGELELPRVDGGDRCSSSAGEKGPRAAREVPGRSLRSGPAGRWIGRDERSSGLCAG